MRCWGSLELARRDSSWRSSVNLPMAWCPQVPFAPNGVRSDNISEDADGRTDATASGRMEYVGGKREKRESFSDLTRTRGTFYRPNAPRQRRSGEKN